MIAYLHRMRIYLGEMFPVGRHLLLAATTYLAVAAFARQQHDVTSSVWTVYVALGTWSYFAVPLMLRLMDELKDRDIDAALFAGRPLPSGRVHDSDIKISLVVVIVLFLAANAVHVLTLLVAAAIVGYTLLMFRRFFAEQAHRDSLLLTLATHNPIVPLSMSYGFFLFAAEHELTIAELSWQPVLIFLLLFWMPFLAWELSRKIRSREEENQYVTYTRLLGARGAVAAVLLTQFLSLVAALALHFCCSVSAAIVLVPALFWLISFWAGMRFLRRPDSRTSKLRYFAEAYAVAVIAGALIALRGELL